MAAPKIIVTEKLHIYTDEDNIEYVIPRSEDLDRALTDIEKLLDEQREKVAAAASDPDQAKWRVEDNLYRRIVAERDHLLSLRHYYLPKATLRTYELIRPSYEEYLAFKETPGVSEVDDDAGMIRVNRDKLAQAMLPVSVKGMTEQQVRTLSPDIFQRLFLKLERACSPNAANLPTIAQPSGLR